MGERRDLEELLAGEALDQQRRGMLATSIRARTRRLRHLAGWLAPRSLLDATRHDIETYLDTLGISPASRANYLSHFHAFYRWAAAEGLLDGEPPTARIIRPRRRRRLPRPISTEDLQRALAGAHGQLRCFLILAAYQGLRVHEIAGLHGEDVDRHAGMLTVRHGKGDKDRALPLHPLAAAVLPDHPGPLFHQPSGAQILPHNVSRQVNEYLHRVGISATAHCLRHAFATNLYRATRDLRLTQEMLGHTSPATTAVYAAFDPERAAVVRRLSYGLPDEAA